MRSALALKTTDNKIISNANFIDNIDFIGNIVFIANPALCLTNIRMANKVY
ncbi:hypothetical protein NBRC116591_37160 [Sessilibacter corallicola]|uniref:Uncharacterized protein n=1 Tax=Sessilibacter corallicola TaxID=2904075 RepID=A0ABQ0AE26_9GAMM